MESGNGISAVSSASGVQGILQDLINLINDDKELLLELLIESEDEVGFLDVTVDYFLT